MSGQAFLNQRRWLITAKSIDRPRAYFNENTARRAHQALLDSGHATATITEQVLVDDTWEAAAPPPAGEVGAA